MTDILINGTYKLVSKRWKLGTITIREIELLVKATYLNREQADAIYLEPRQSTDISIADPFSYEALTRIQTDLINNGK